jgi:ribulose-phosphate 3-epimerase
MSKEMIPIASDHPGFDLKQELVQYLSELGYQPVDLGTYSKERVDYPVYSLSVADRISKGACKRGIVICKTGIGVSIVANKFPNVRAGLATNPEIAKLTKEHNNTNVLALGAGYTTTEDAKKIVNAWLEAEPEGGRHQKRIEQIMMLEQNNMGIGGSHQLIASATMNSAVEDVKISASLMCANQLNLMNDVDNLIEAGIDMLHIDIIDGEFAPNVSMNVEHIGALRKHTTHPLDVHLMVKNPRNYIQRAVESGANIITFHIESNVNVEDEIEFIKNKGIKVGLAVEVDTPLSEIEKYATNVDIILFMTVKTGFKASQLESKVIDKVRAFSEYKKQNKLNTIIMVDGSVGPRSLPHLYRAGARIFVGGTSGLFKAGTLKENISQMKSFCN